MTPEQKPKAIEILAEIRTVMMLVRNFERPLDMCSWITDPASTNVSEMCLHNCGTAACVIGYASLSPDIRQIVGEGEVGEDGNPDNYNLRADTIMDYLTDIGIPYRLKWALAGTDNDERQDFYAGLNLPPEVDKSEKLRHLTSDEPTPADAIEFIDHMVKLVEGDYV